MLRGVKEVNYFIAFEITLMQRAMVQASFVSCCVGGSKSFAGSKDFATLEAPATLETTATLETPTTL